MAILISLSFDSHLQASSSPGKHFPNAQTMLGTYLYTFIGPLSPFERSHNCNHIFIYFVIVMKWSLLGFYSACFNQDRAPVFSISVYVASYCQIILPETAVSIMPP